MNEVKSTATEICIFGVAYEAKKKRVPCVYLLRNHDKIHLKNFKIFYVLNININYILHPTNLDLGLVLVMILVPLPVSFSLSVLVTVSHLVLLLLLVLALVCLERLEEIRSNAFLNKGFKAETRLWSLPWLYTWSFHLVLSWLQNKILQQPVFQKVPSIDILQRTPICRETSRRHHHC